MQTAIGTWEKSRQQDRLEKAVNSYFEPTVAVQGEGTGDPLMGGVTQQEVAGPSKLDQMVASEVITPGQKEYFNSLKEAGAYGELMGSLGELTMREPPKAADLVEVVDPVTGRPKLVAAKDAVGLEKNTAGSATRQDYNIAKRNGEIPDGMSYLQFAENFRAKGTTVSVDVDASTGPDFGKTPPGTMRQVLLNPDGTVLTDNQGRAQYEIVPLPGSKPAAEAAAAADAAANKQSQKDLNTAILTDDIDRTLAMIDEGVDVPVLGNTQVGLIGSIMGAVPGSPQHDLKNMLTGIQARGSFDELQQMREASPTGGALGGVSAPELDMLRMAKGAVMQSGSKEVLQYNLNRLKSVYRRIATGQGDPAYNIPNHQNYVPMTSDVSASGEPQKGPSTDELLRKYGQ